MRKAIGGIERFKEGDKVADVKFEMRRKKADGSTDRFLPFTTTEQVFHPLTGDPLDQFLEGVNQGFGDGSDGDITDNFTVSLPSDDDYTAVIQARSINLPAGKVITVNKRCRGLIIFCQGDCVINGEINLVGKAAYAVSPNGKDIEMPLGTVIYSTPRGGVGGKGGDGGRGACGSGGYNGGFGGISSPAPSKGMWWGGSPGGGGGGGGGGYGYGKGSSANGGQGGDGGTVDVNLPIGTPGAGGSGRDGSTFNGAPGDNGGNFCGGGGGAGGWYRDPNYTGGKGGIGYGAGGGGGSGKRQMNSTTPNVGGVGEKTYGGGLLIIIAKGDIVIGSTGVINCNGAIGGKGGDGAPVHPDMSLGITPGGGGGGQGGGGGGVVVLACRGVYANNGSVTVNGGAGGAGGAVTTNYDSAEVQAVPGTSGTAGSVGSIITLEV